MRRLPKISCLLFVVPACLPASSWADTPVINPPEEIIVTATRTPQKKSRTLQQVIVIPAEDLAQGGQQTLVEVLQIRGGVEITSTGGFGQPGAVRIRGAENRHTLVLIDGMRVDSATAGATALENIPLSQIERIEIVSAPLSSLYGSDAIGGVIQVFTKSGRRAPGYSVTAGAGAYNTRTLSAGITSHLNDTEFSINLGYLGTGGLNVTKPTIPFAQHNPDADPYHNTSLSGKITHHFSGGNEIGASIFQSEGVAHFDAGLATDDISRQTQSAFSVYSRNPVSDVWQSLVRVGTSRDNQAAEGAFPGYFRTNQHQFTWQNDFQFKTSTITAGLEYLDQHVASDAAAYKQTSRNVKSVFAGYYGDFGSHGLQASLRQDDNSQFGGRATGSLGYGYHISKEVRLRASVGTAFKAPTFNDLYFPDFPPFFFSNPNLRPERSVSREVGVVYQGGNQHLAATLFENRISDQITIVTDPATFVATTQNLSQAIIRGIELSYSGTLFGLQGRANLSLQKPQDGATGALLRLRAEQHGSLALAKAIGPWKLGTELTASSARFDSTTEAPGSRLHGYGLMNLTASYALKRNWTLNTRWNNVLNRDYELVQHFNTPGSNLFVSLQYTSR